MVDLGVPSPVIKLAAAMHLCLVLKPGCNQREGVGATSD